MANRRDLVKRRSAVRNIRKITRTMQLIATARFQAAHKRLVASTPFTDKLAQLVRDLAGATAGVDHPLMQVKGEGQPADLVVITSNRGLCGAYNGNVLRTAGDFLQRLEQQSLPYSVLSAGRQVPVVEQLLPLSSEVSDESVNETGQTELEYEFSPAPEDLLDELLPMTVRARLFRCFNDAVVSEQMARQVAMKSATDSAEDLIKLLTQKYNRARQTAITMELLDIVGGANALA
ncbi:MAG: F0F1 ATP synthase subunit gamma [Acidobacteriota bacterium]